MRRLHAGTKRRFSSINAEPASGSRHLGVGSVTSLRVEQGKRRETNGGRRREEELLAACYRNSLALGLAHGVASIAFPAISTGVYRFPLELASAIAARECRAFLDAQPSFGTIALVAFREADAAVMRAAVGEGG